jgi:uncharacterized protein (DUF58 family)
MRRSVYVLMLLALLGLALITGFGPFYFLLYALTAAVGLGYFWAWIQAQSLDVEVAQLDLHPQVGKSMLFRIVAKEKMGIPRVGLRIRLSGTGFSTSERVIDLASRSNPTWTEVLEAQWRGEGTIGSLDIITSDPLGLVRLERRIGEPHSALIYPETVSLPAEAAARYGGLGEGGDFSRRAHESISASKVREYMPGDSPRNIHWPTTARRGQLMTKEFDSGGEIEEIWLFLDMQATSHVGAGVAGTEETGVVIAASLAQILLGAGKSVGLAVKGDVRYVINPSREPEQLWEILSALAMVRAQGQTPLPTLIAQEGTVLEQGAHVVVIAPWPGQGLSGLSDHLYRRGITMLPVLLDVASFGRHHDARWLRDPHIDFPGGASLIRLGTDPAEALLFVMERLMA